MTYVPYYSFAGDGAQLLSCTPNNTIPVNSPHDLATPATITVDFGQDVSVSAVEVGGSLSGRSTPDDFYISGSDDDATYTVLPGGAIKASTVQPYLVKFR